MDSPVIQLLFKGRVVQTLLFQSDVLRIGRMKENDIVISNASVSRFHAVLKRENGQVILEDSGSENGCYVNGTRVAGSIALAPGDEVQIGKHQLILSEGGEEEPLPSEVVRPEKSDAWDASNTYFVGVDTQAKMLAGSGSKPVETLEEERDPPLPVEPEAVAEEETPPKETAPAADDAEVAVESPWSQDASSDPMDAAEEEVEAWTPESDDAEEESEPDESPFAFGVDADLVSPEPGGKLEVDPEEYDVELTDEDPEEGSEEAVEVDEPSTPEQESPAEPTWYAGLIIQHRGKLERVISWDEDRLTAGRSRECEIYLDQVEISRRHAMFVREEERYQVRDLDSINGIFVNGEKIKRRDLEVGDVVKIEDFELTFLLDRQPIASEIVTSELSAPGEAAAEDRFDMTVIGEQLPISSADDASSSAEEPVERVEEETEMPEDSLFGPDEDEKEDLIEVDAVSLAPPEVAAPAVAVATDEVVTFEVRVRLEDLPRPLRTALAELDESDLRLPVELVLKTEAGDSSQG